MVAAEGDTLVVVAVVGLISAAVSAGITKWFEWRASKDVSHDTMTVSLYKVGQESLQAALVQANADIRDLRAQVAEMRAELKITLAHAKECDDARMAQATELEQLRALLKGGS